MTNVNTIQHPVTPEAFDTWAAEISNHAIDPVAQATFGYSFCPLSPRYMAWEVLRYS